jgi:hypothetical protein
MKRFLLIFWVAAASASPSPLPDRLQAAIDDAILALNLEGRCPIPSWLRLQLPGPGEKPAFGQRYAGKIDIKTLAECSREWPFVLTGDADELRAHQDGRLCTKTALFDGKRWQALDPPADLRQFRWLPGGIMYRAGDRVLVFPAGSAVPDESLGDTVPADAPISMTELGFHPSAPCKLYVKDKLWIYDSHDRLWLSQVANSAPAPGLGILLGTDLAVLAVTAGSPAAKARIETGDTLLAMDDQPLALRAALWRRLTERKPGESVQLRLDGSAPRSVELILGPQRPLFPPLAPGYELASLLESRKPLVADITWVADEASAHGVARALEAMSNTQTLPSFASVFIDRLRAHGVYQAWSAAGMALGLNALGELEEAEDAHEHGLGLPNYGSRLLTERFAFQGARHPWQQLRDDLKVPARHGGLDATGLASELPPLLLNSLLLEMLEAEHFPPGASEMILQLWTFAYGQLWYLDTVAWCYAATGDTDGAQAIFQDNILPHLTETAVDQSLLESYRQFQAMYMGTKPRR